MLLVTNWSLTNVNDYTLITHWLFIDNTDVINKLIRGKKKSSFHRFHLKLQNENNWSVQKEGSYRIL